MITCPSCGFEAPDDFAFCPKCATALTAPPPVPEERKVVTTLVCDLVGFTAMSEAADPEDVDRILSDYFARASKAIESHGGTVEKFIGDAVVGVFGVPAVHEDDPERAVRAGLRLLEALEGLTRPDGSPLQARIGVNTGEALVRLDRDPASGRGFVTGDAVNVAARLQAIAPPMGAVVGELTHALTSTVIVYEAMGPLELKGKGQPAAAWLAKATVSRTGLRSKGETTTPFVGRQGELDALRASLRAATRDRVARFYLLVGEPGIGKSRLLLELARSLDEEPDLVTWRQACCPAYAEEVTFLVIAELVRAHAGILDSDDVASMERKLEAVLPDSSDRSWLRQRLRALVGLKATQAEHAESFAAWTLFLAHVASPGPTVLVFEDLHWADEATLDFVKYLCAQELRVPLLVLATTRPELLSRRADILRPSQTVRRVGLSPLTHLQGVRLLGALLGGRLAKDLSDAILERVGGNPLYAEEYLRLLLDRGLLTRTDGVLHLQPGEQLPVPDTVQAVLAARLDTLPREHKALLCKAAVFGETFWDGGIAALAERDPHDMVPVMAALAERQLLRRASSSSLDGETEYLFWHTLVRDIAYDELPRRSRVGLHVAAARWLQAKAGDRADDIAELRAHHLATALELAKKTGQADVADSLVDSAVNTLALAGTNVRDVDVSAAQRHFGKALEFVGEDSTQRLRLLALWAMTLSDGGHHGEAIPVLEEVIPPLRAAGEHRLAAEGLVCLSGALLTLGRLGYLEHSLAAISLLEQDEASSELVFALYSAAGIAANSSESERALQLAERAMTVAQDLGLTPWGDALDCAYSRAALAARGIARCQLGDGDGLEDLREAKEAALSKGIGLSPIANYAFVSQAVWGPRSSIPVYEQCIELSRRRGLVVYELAAGAGLLQARATAGDWQEVIETSRSLLLRPEAAEDVLALVSAKLALALVFCRRGDTEAALPLVVWSLDKARVSRLSLELCLALVVAAAVHMGRHGEECHVLLKELISRLDADFALEGVHHIPEALRTVHLEGDHELSKQLTDWVPSALPTQRCARTYGEALLAETRGEFGVAAAAFADAAVGWHDFGVPYEEAQALLGQGRCLVALDKAPEAAPVLAQARGIFKRLEAKPALAETEKLLEHGMLSGS